MFLTNQQLPVWKEYFHKIFENFKKFWRYVSHICVTVYIKGWNYIVLSVMKGLTIWRRMIVITATIIHHLFTSNQRFLATRNSNIILQYFRLILKRTLQYYKISRRNISSEPHMQICVFPAVTVLIWHLLVSYTQKFTSKVVFVF